MKKLHYTATKEDLAHMQFIREWLDTVVERNGYLHHYAQADLANDIKCCVIGSGSFGVVYAHPTNPRLCIKVGLGGDHQKGYHWNDPWMGFAAYCLRHPKNANLPGMYALLVYPQFYLALMERVEPSNGTTTHRSMYRAMESAAHLHSYDETLTYSSYVGEPTFNRWVGMFRAIRKIAEYARIDIHSGNIMFRGTTPVVVDPIAWDYTKDDAKKAIRPLTNRRTVRLCRCGR